MDTLVCISTKIDGYMYRSMADETERKRDRETERQRDRERERERERDRLGTSRETHR